MYIYITFIILTNNNYNQNNYYNNIKHIYTKK